VHATVQVTAIPNATRFVHLDKPERGRNKLLGGDSAIPPAELAKVQVPMTYGFTPVVGLPEPQSDNTRRNFATGGTTGFVPMPHRAFDSQQRYRLR